MDVSIREALKVIEVGRCNLIAIFPFPLGNNYLNSSRVLLSERASRKRQVIQLTTLLNLLSVGFYKRNFRSVGHAMQGEFSPSEYDMVSGISEGGIGLGVSYQVKFQISDLVVG